MSHNLPLSSTELPEFERMSRILIIDDEPAMLQLIQSTLDSQYLCESVLSAEHASRLLETDGPYDLVICDVRLKGMNGIELLKHIRSRYTSTSTILMSSAQRIELVVDALRARADDYLIKPFDLLELGEAVRRVCELRQRPHTTESELREYCWDAATRALSLALRTRDMETNGHAMRVEYFSLRLGLELGLTKEEMLNLKFGSRLHDVGKIGVPDQILRKAGALTDEERQKMMVHPTVGQNLVRRLSLPEGAAEVVGQHHERWDGSGYPQGLSGCEISLPARIFSVIDAYDAIVSDRCYRAGRSYAEAAAEIRQHSGTQFDPQVVAAFLKIPALDWERLRLTVEKSESATEPKGELIR